MLEPFPKPEERAIHNELQRSYYENALNKPAMQIADSPYVLRHVERVANAIKLRPGQRILEVGSGLGKFSIPLIERGLDLTCLDISPIMMNLLQDRVTGRGLAVKTVACDIADAGANLPVIFDRVIGFFTLHHMHNLEVAFRGVRSVLLPGAKVAFCEPLARNPLYYLQIATTPGMHWRAEKGIVNMRSSVVFSAMKAAGLTTIARYSYGFFPPFIVNQKWGARLEDVLNRYNSLQMGHAFQIFCAVNPDRT